MARPHDVVSDLERKHILEILERDGVRLDGRKPMEMRPIRFVMNFAEKAEGSATISLGKTKIAVGIKAQVGAPFPDTPDQGVLITNLELPPLASPLFEAGPPRAPAIELARVVDRGIRESGSIALDTLKVGPGNVWILFVDCYVLDDFGNVLDATSMAAMAALASSKLPKAAYNEEEGIVEYLEEKTPLPIQTMIATFTFAKIGDYIVLDPDADEERVLSTRFTVSVTEDGHVCALQKGEPGTFTRDEIMTMLREAQLKAPVVISMIKETVANPTTTELSSVFEEQT